MTADTHDLTPCLCGCGDLVRGEWRRGHYSRGVGGYAPPAAAGGLAPLPPPAGGAPDDLDEMDPDELGPEPGPPGPGSRFGPGDEDTGGPEPEPEPEPVRPDPPAAKVPSRPAGGRHGPPRKITAAVRSDVEGKFGLMLEMAGRVWASRDPVCGGTFLAQLPAIRPAAVDLILLSPDLVAWFTGVGGGFMLWFNLAGACWPVAVTAWAHHVAHAEDQGAGPAAQAYAA